jgi:hypothetical protein
MDVFIVKQLKNLRKIKPSSSLLSKQRSFLLSEISRIEEPIKQVSETGKRFLIFPVFNFSKLLKPVYALAFVLIILVSSLGTVSVISAAQNSLPGDPLYGLKTAFEKTQMTFASSQEAKVKLSIKFVNQRIDEFAQIAGKPEKKQEIQKTVDKLNSQLVSIQDEISQLKDRNDKKALEVAKLIKEQTANYKQTIIKLSEQLAYIMPEEKGKLDQTLIEANKIQEKSDEIIKAGEIVPEKSNILVPANEENKDSESIPFEKINE